MSYNRMLLKGIRDLINLSHFDPIIRMIPLTVIPLSGAHCSWQEINAFKHFENCTGFSISEKQKKEKIIYKLKVISLLVSKAK